MNNLLNTPVNIFSHYEFMQAYNAINNFLPGVKHHYAHKALPISGCVKKLDAMGGYLDLASVGEMELVQQSAAGMLSRSIYTHPVKTKRDIQKALDYGIRVLIVDNELELEKLIPFRTEVKILVRLAFPNMDARINLSEKFGISYHQAPKLLEQAFQYGFDVLGCCFHVGSGLNTPKNHVDAIKKCADLYKWVRLTFKKRMPILDIGGGFPPYQRDIHHELELFFNPIQEALEQFFEGVEVWSEPGRFLSSPSLCCVASVIGKKMKDTSFFYYLNDGIYGSLSGKVFDQANYILEPLCDYEAVQYPTIFSGPTCDSLDIICSDIMCRELDIDDLILIKNAGAYTRASSTMFNLLPAATLIETFDSFDCYFNEFKNQYHMGNLRYA